MVEDKVTTEKLDAFKARIHGLNGSVPLVELKKLNSVYKREYIQKVIYDDNAIREQLK